MASTKVDHLYLNPEEFSETYYVRSLSKKDIPVILELCAGNPVYYEYCPPPASEDGILSDLHALPEGKSDEDKYYIGYYDEEMLIAVMDLIKDFPEEGIAWIGFFMAKISIQHQGIGTGIIGDLCHYLAKKDFSEVRLWYMRENPQCNGFWSKSGFRTVSERTDSTGKAIIVANRSIP